MDGQLIPNVRSPFLRTSPSATTHYLVDREDAEVMIDYSPHYPDEAAEVVSMIEPGYECRPLRQRGLAPAADEAPKPIDSYDVGDLVDVWWDNIWWQGVVSGVTKRSSAKGINIWKKSEITIVFPQISWDGVQEVKTTTKELVRPRMRWHNLEWLPVTAEDEELLLKSAATTLGAMGRVLRRRP